jgi:hypothetical protein
LRLRVANRLRNLTGVLGNRPAMSAAFGLRLFHYAKLGHKPCVTGGK